MKLLIATTNPNKVREIHVALAGLTTIDLMTLADLPPIVEPEETAATFWENARIKALAYARASGLTAVAEDSGLEIAALDGAARREFGALPRTRRAVRGALRRDLSTSEDQPVSLTRRTVRDCAGSGGA